MNKIFKSFILLLGFSAAVSSCQFPAEPISEIDYSRVLTPLKFEAEVVPSTGTDVTFTWQDMKNADSYLLEIYEIPENTEAIPSNPSGKPVCTKDVKKTEIPYTVYGLEVDKTFYARVQGCSDKLQASNWAYLVDSFSTSAVRSSLNPIVEERTSTSITITWNPLKDKKDLTSIKVEPVLPIEGEKARTIPLTEQEIEGCSKTVDGLTPAKEYRFTLLFGKAGKRGVVTAFARPSTEGTNKVNSASAILNAIADGANKTVKLLVEYSDTPYEFIDLYPVETSKFATVAGDLYIYGESAADGKKPVLNGLTFSLAEGATVLHIEDLCFDGQNEGTLCANPKAAMTSVEYVNCEITNFSKAIYSNGSSDTGSAKNFLIDGCYVHDINATGANGGDFIDVRGGANGDFLLQNSTFYAVARTFLRASDKATINSAAIKNCTFNYVTSTTGSSNNAGIFHVRQTTGAKSLQCLNNVFLNQYNDKEDATDATKSWVRMARNSTDSYSPYCSGNVYYHVGAAWWTSSAPGAPDDPNTGLTFSEELGMKDGLMLTEDPCVNSEAGKLYLTSKGAAIVSKNAGDPKWWDAVQPIIIRPTELEVAPDEYTWDFTDKTVYDTEELVENTIIGNARIYATALVPAQVTMSKGLTLSAASVSPAGVPSYGAVEILTSGYGSVKVTAESADGFGSVQVIAGGDRYALLADGKEHIVNLGDLRDENSIFVIADQEITLKKVVWTKDLTPEADKIVLDTPVVTVAPTSVFVGDSQDVIISWNEVKNAAMYVLTTNDGTVTIAKTSYTIPGTDIATFATGEYEFTVVAQPVLTSTKYAESEAGKAKLTVNAKTPTVTWKWNFTEDYSSSINVSDSNIYKYEDGAVTQVPSSDAQGQLYFAPTSKAIKSNNLSCTADGITYHPLSYGGGAAYMFFNTAKSGKLRVTATIGKSPSDAKDCKLGIKVNGAAYGNDVDLAAYDLSVAGCAAKTFEWNIVNAGSEVQQISIVKPSGSNSPFIFSVEFEYEAAAPVVTMVNISDFTITTVEDTHTAGPVTFVSSNAGGKKWAVDSNSKSWTNPADDKDSFSFTKRIKSGGKSDFLKRGPYFEIPVAKGATIELWFMSGSSGSVRSVSMLDGTFSDSATVLETASNDGAAIGYHSFTYNGNTGKAVFTVDNGVNFYGIRVTTTE